MCFVILLSTMSISVTRKKISLNWTRLIMSTVILLSPFIIPIIGSSADSNNVDVLAEKPSKVTLKESEKSYFVSSITPQFVLLSFDGSKSLSMLEEIQNFSKRMEFDGRRVRFTFFINAAYFLTDDNAAIYKSPRGAPGDSKIGYSNSIEDIRDRVAAFNKVVREGGEIASHAAGHWNGQYWSEEEWKKEFNSFKSIIYNVQVNNGAVTIEKPIFLVSMMGFRPPEIGVNENLYKTLKDFGFKYDTSNVGAKEDWPYMDSFGIWHIPIGTISLGVRGVPALAMDYSLWVYQTGGRDYAAQNTPEWNNLYREVLDAYLAYFNANYYGSRAPVVIGHHFTKMGDGVYFEALKSFAEEVCGKPSVRCSTYSDFVEYLNEYGVPTSMKIRQIRQ